MDDDAVNFPDLDPFLDLAFYKKIFRHTGTLGLKIHDTMSETSINNPLNQNQKANPDLH